jgi:hypothetical protein
MSCSLQGSFSCGLVMVSADALVRQKLACSDYFSFPKNWEDARPVVEFSKEVTIRLIVLIKT